MQVIDETAGALAESPPCNGHGHPVHAHPVISQAVLQAAARLGAALGDPARLRVLWLLAAGEHCVSQLASETGESLPVTSQRLKVLLTARLVTRSREGRHVVYRLADAHVAGILEQLFQHSSESPVAATTAALTQGEAS